MEIIFTVNHNNLIAFADLNNGQIFKMVNTDDVRTFGEDCLCMKTDTGDFVTLTGTKCNCGMFCEPGCDLSDGSNTIVEKVPNAVIALT